MSTLQPSMAVVASVLICFGCGSAPTSSTGAASPTATAPSATGSLTPLPTATLVACQDMPNQIYVNNDFGVSISCPSNFMWQTYPAFQPIPALVFHARAVDKQYIANYPPGQVQIQLYSMDADTLRAWINKHIGPQMSTDPQHYWDTTSNVSDVTMAGRSALAFDYTLFGPEAPETNHAVAVVHGSKYVLVVEWWAYQASYRATIGSIGEGMVTSVKTW